MIGSKPHRVRARPSTTNNGLVIEVLGAFNLEVHSDFRQAYEVKGKGFGRYAVNLGQCTSLDSAGLGMLLLLRDHSGLPKKDLIITNCSKDVRQVLRYANFDQIFTIIE